MSSTSSSVEYCSKVEGVEDGECGNVECADILYSSIGDISKVEGRVVDESICNSGEVEFEKCDSDNEQQYDELRYRDEIEGWSDKLWQFIEQNPEGHRRVLHDSIRFEWSDRSAYAATLATIVRSLRDCSWYVVACHDETTSKESEINESETIKEAVEKLWYTYGNSDKRKIWEEFCEEERKMFGDTRSFECNERIEDCSNVDRQCRPLPITAQTSIADNGDMFLYKQRVEFIEGIVIREQQLRIPEKGHFHVVHPCSWANRQCTHISRYFDCAPRRNKIKTFAFTTRGHVSNTLLYLGALPRFICHYKMPNESSRHCIIRAKCFRQTDLRSGNEPNVSMETQLEKSENDLSEQSARPSGQSINEIDEPMRKKNRVSSNDGNDKTKEIIRFVMKYPTSPVESIMRTSFWEQNDNVNTMIASDKLLQRVFNLVNIKLSKMSYNQFISYYQSDDIVECVWQACNYESPNDYYYLTDKSLSIVEQLLEYQLSTIQEFNDLSKQEMISKFCTDLFNVLEMKIPKKNTFYLESPPSAGKNFLIDAVSAWYLNVGNIQNFNKFNNFPLMEAINRRINIWNEPNIEPSAFDTVKMLLAGDPMKASVKYQQEQPLLRTPIIVMTNKRCFPNTDAFNDRMIVYHWIRAPFLRSYTDKISPSVWPRLVDKYVKL